MDARGCEAKKMKTNLAWHGRGQQSKEVTE